ncbi:MAG: H-X9-DG-CTERM domain-containing protein [Gemmataceae bacterium]
MRKPFVDGGQIDGVERRTSYLMNSLLSHRPARYGQWTLMRFVNEVGTSQFICFSERNAAAFSAASGGPRQDDYDIWLGTGIIKPWIAHDRHTGVANYLYLDGHVISLPWDAAVGRACTPTVVLTQDGSYRVREDRGGEDGRSALNRAWVALLAGLLAGCGRTPATPPGTGGPGGGRGSTRNGCCGGAGRRRTPRLDGDSRTRCGADRFALLAQGYRAGLGFEPEAVHLRACEGGAERGSRRPDGKGRVGEGTPVQGRREPCGMSREVGRPLAEELQSAGR